MSALNVPARARTRLVPVLVSALVASLAVFGLSPVPAANAADPVLSFVGATSQSGNRTNHTVPLPTGLQNGDTLVLFLTTNSLSGTLTGPAGWTQIQSKDGTATRGRAWTKQAVAADSGTTVTVAGSAIIKDTMSVAAYRSDVGTSSVTASASVAGTDVLHQPHHPLGRRRPGRLLAGQLLEREVLDRRSTWTAPPASSTRATPAATGGGKVSSLLADSGAPVPTGTAAGRTATTSVAGGRRPAVLRRDQPRHARRRRRRPATSRRCRRSRPRARA